MAMDDLFQSLNDSMETDPPDLERAVTDVFVSALAKRLAEEREKPWTDKNESDMQERISTLIAAANARGLETIRLIVTRANGEKVSRELDIDRISKTRSLQ